MRPINCPPHRRGNGPWPHRLAIVACYPVLFSFGNNQSIQAWHQKVHERRTASSSERKAYLYLFSSARQLPLWPSGPQYVHRVLLPQNPGYHNPTEQGNWFWGRDHASEVGRYQIHVPEVYILLGPGAISQSERFDIHCLSKFPRAWVLLFESGWRS